MSPKKKAKKAEDEVLGFDEIDLDSMVVCGACGSPFYTEIADLCPRCQGKGLKNPDGFDKDGFDKDGFDKDGFDEDGYDREGLDRKGETRHFKKGW